MIFDIVRLEEDYINALPEVIKHEYCRIFELLDEHENYGAMMQLKDLSETIIKLYASIGLAKIYNKSSKCEDEIKLLFEVTDKVLSLGDWAGIIVALLQFDIDDDLRNICQGIQELTDPTGRICLVEWRNKSLGHGALGYLSDKEYQDSFVRIYNGIAEFIKDYYSYISQLRVIENKPEKKISVKYCDETILHLFPFVTFDDGKLFFFDSFYKSKRRFEALNYYYGIRKSYKKGAAYEAINKIHEDYKTSVEKSSLSTDESYENDVFSYEMEEIVKNNSYAKDAVKAEYMERWLNEKIKKYDKGVFWLQMPKETGKTVITQQLEKKGNAKIVLNNITVNALYLNNTYNSDIDLILQELEILLTHKNGHLLIKGKNKPVFDKHNPNTKEEMAHYINSMYRILVERHIILTQKLLLVFDGLDELKSSSFCDYIPEEDQLDPHIYILLTSVPVEDLTAEKKVRFHQIQATEIYSPSMKESVEVTMLKFIHKARPDFDEASCYLYLNIAKGNFGYLQFMLKYSGILGTTLNNTFSTEDIFTIYLNYLYSVYGDKYCKKLFLTLYIFANISYGISLKALSQILGEHKVSFELIGVLQDISGLITVSHFRESYYKINNPLLQEALKTVMVKHQFFDYEKVLSRVLSDQLGDIFDDFVHNGLVLNEDEYRLIKTLFVCEFDSFIRMLNYYFTSSILAATAVMIYATFNDYYKKLSAEIEILFEKLCYFCTIQVEMIEAGLKKDDSKEADNYKVLTIVFASDRPWERWYFEKARLNDTDDLLNEASEINSIYQNLILLKDNLPDEIEEKLSLNMLLDYRIVDILQKIQRIYIWMDLPDLVIKYTDLMIQIMNHEESEFFFPDYAGEFRILSNAYESKGDLKHAKQYELMAIRNEKENGKLSEEAAEYLKRRARSEEFSHIVNIIESKKDTSLIFRAVQIEKEHYSYIISKLDKKERPSINEYLNCIDMECKLAELFHRFGNREKNVHWYERLRSLINTMDEEYRSTFFVEITYNMINYAANLVEWQMINEADNILETYVGGIDLIDDIVFQQTLLSNSEHSYVLECISIAYYTVDSILHPERTGEIVKARNNLTPESLYNCNMIISSQNRKQTMDDTEKPSYFSYLEETDQYVCKRNLCSKKGKLQKGKVIYKFNSQKCKSCERFDCPAKKSPNSIVIEE